MYSRRNPATVTVFQRARRVHACALSQRRRASLGSLSTNTRKSARAAREAPAATALAEGRPPDRDDAGWARARVRGAVRALQHAPAGLLPAHAFLARGRRGRAPGGLRRRSQR